LSLTRDICAHARQYVPRVLMAREGARERDITLSRVFSDRRCRYALTSR